MSWARSLCPTVGAMAVLSAGCGGASPMMHTAFALAEDEITLGGGFAGQVTVAEPDLTAEQIPERALEEGAIAPGLSPWVGARYGIGYDFDAGLTYSGRTIRLDGRRSFLLDDEEKVALSLGIGASALMPKRDDDLALRVGGFGGDIPLLFGWRSTADIYSVWIGARGGMEYLNGQRELEVPPDQPDLPPAEDIEGWHAHAGGLLGLRIGFRYVFAVLELGAAMHWAEADVGAVHVSVQEFALAPAGALIIKF
jgi:hypothetical protein